MKNKKGFTLVELLAVIVVLAIVMLVVADRVGDAMLKSRGNSLALQVKSLNREVEKVGAMDNQITTEKINEIVSSGDLKYLGYIKAGTGNFDNDVIVVQAQKGSKFANIAYTKDIEDLGTLAENYIDNNLVLNTDSLKDKKEWLREPIIYFETTVPVVEKVYAVGDVVSIGAEKFNVIKDNGDSVIMLAKNVLDRNTIMQSESNDWVNVYGVVFAEEKQDKKPSSSYGYWTDDSGNLLPKYGSTYPANVYDSNSNTYNIVEAYVDKLKGIKQIPPNDKTTLTGRLIYMSELVELGYPSDGCGDFTNNENETWLTNGQSWWSGSAFVRYSVRTVDTNGDLSYSNFWNAHRGVRPVITIKKSLI